MAQVIASTEYTDPSQVHGKAMLVTLSISQWSARRIDKRASADVAKANNVESNKGTYYKSLVEGGSLEAIKKLAIEARAEHYRRTLPWSDAGPRVLSSLGYFDYMAAMHQFGAKFDKLVDAFVSDYPLLRQEASRLLGDLFDDGEYPNLNMVASKFRFITAVSPLPIGDDFRCDLGSEEVARIRDEITAQSGAATAAAMRDAYQRVADVVERFIDRLASPETVFKNTLVTNARDLADILPSLNLTGDPALTAIAAKIKDQLCAHEPDQLRNDAASRRAAYEAAMRVQSDLMGVFSGGMQ